MKLSKLRQFIPGRRGMGTTAKVLMVTLPVLAFVAGRMWGNLMDDNSPE